MVYMDTSALLKKYIHEAGSQIIGDLWKHTDKIVMLMGNVFQQGNFGFQKMD